MSATPALALAGRLGLLDSTSFDTLLTPSPAVVWTAGTGGAETYSA